MKTHDRKTDDNPPARIILIEPNNNTEGYITKVMEETQILSTCR